MRYIQDWQIDMAVNGVWWVLGFFLILGIYANATDPVMKRMRDRGVD